ncbi:hypothetical protein [Hymenobacter persicinus]|uniref:Uncharacterized protein n=1 Tax=Hymenobacter persicinus TaxID=2025506 RepID=A0A4Q5LD74_9BACT|nr:hypothetical protein [Hymenobacter persicinus]RYU79732.1 hypothetical protein EWM57_09990 [Hymenobacter persicinus]
MNILQIQQLMRRVTPRLLGWALGGLVGVLVLSPFTLGLLSDEQVASRMFAYLVGLCLLPLPWIGPYVAWQLANQVTSPFWKAGWRFLTVAGCAGALLASIGIYWGVAFTLG